MLFPSKVPIPPSPKIGICPFTVSTRIKLLCSHILEFTCFSNIWKGIEYFSNLGIILANRFSMISSLILQYAFIAQHQTLKYNFCRNTWFNLDNIRLLCLSGCSLYVVDCYHMKNLECNVKILECGFFFLAPW